MVRLSPGRDSWEEVSGNNGQFTLNKLSGDALLLLESPSHKPFSRHTTGGQCDMVCYQEREREVNSSTLLCLNQQSLRLTAKTVGEWRSKLLALYDLQPVEQRKEPRSLEYHNRMKWWEKEKVKWLAHREKHNFSLEEIWKKNFSSGQTLARDRHQFSQLWEKVSP